MEWMVWLKIVIAVSIIVIALGAIFDRHVRQSLINIANRTFGNRTTKKWIRFFKNYWSIPVGILLLLYWFFFH
ncbi:MAG: hypothetical protein Kow0037_16200 [Calditrichia bacterium]